LLGDLATHAALMTRALTDREDFGPLHDRLIERPAGRVAPDVVLRKLEALRDAVQRIETRLRRRRLGHRPAGAQRAVAGLRRFRCPDASDRPVAGRLSNPVMAVAAMPLPANDPGRMIRRPVSPQAIDP